MRLRSGLFVALLMGCLTLASACGGSSSDSNNNAANDGGGNGDGGGDGDGDGDGDGGGGGGGGCVAEDPEAPECNNCVDDDGDGLADGDDPHCSGSLDNDEASFATGIPGDNIDAKKQDCFFDGNSGGDDPCAQIPTCCILGEAECTAQGGTYGTYPGATQCQELFDCYADNASLITCPAPVGCDCFGCCTVCNLDTNACDEIYIGAGAPAACGPEDIGEASITDCVTCEKRSECAGGECNDDPADCILCPGQTEEDLPPECNEMNECPGSSTPCDTSDQCGTGQFCSVGCCIFQVE